MSAQTIIGVSVATVSIILVTVVTMLSVLFRESKSQPVRGLVIATTIVFLLLSPVAVDTLVVWMNRSGGATIVMIDPGWLAKLAPAVIAVVIAIFSGVRGGIRPGRAA